MITIKELIEWHLSTEQPPNTDEICIGSGPGDRHGECFYNAETRMWCWMNSPYVEDEAPPEWWAYMPQGPSSFTKSAKKTIEQYKDAFQRLEESGD